MDNLSVLYSVVHNLFGYSDSILLSTLFIIKESLHSINRELYNLIQSYGLINDIKSLLMTSNNLEMCELCKYIIQRLEEFYKFSFSPK